jgi:type I restriction enzyme S subunit
VNWPQKPLEEVADFCLGKMLDQKKNRGELTPYLANVNVRWGEFDFKNLREMRFEPGELERYGLKSGDIVMCEGGEPGRCAIWKEQVPGMMIQKALHRIRPHECLDSRFLYYSFFKKGKNNELAGFFTGSTIKHLPREKLAQVKVETPPHRAQQRIADILSAYDDLIENNRRRIALLEKAARMLYREWFVRFRFPGHEHVKIIDGIPEGWKIKLLSDLCRLGDGIQTGPFGSQLHQSDYAEIGVPVVMPKDLVGFRIESDGIARIPEELADRLGRHRMEVGDTVYGRRGDIGRRAFIGNRQAGWFCGTGCLRIRPAPTEVVPRYLFETLGSQRTAGFIANQAKGSTMPNLSAGALQKVPILSPSMQLQTLFVKEIEPISELI